MVEPLPNENLPTFNGFGQSILVTLFLIFFFTTFSIKGSTVGFFFLPIRVVFYLDGSTSGKGFPFFSAAILAVLSGSSLFIGMTQNVGIFRGGL